LANAAANEKKDPEGFHPSGSFFPKESKWKLIAACYGINRKIQSSIRQIYKDLNILQRLSTIKDFLALWLNPRQMIEKPENSIDLLSLDSIPRELYDGDR